MSGAAASGLRRQADLDDLRVLLLLAALVLLPLDLAYLLLDSDGPRDDAFRVVVALFDVPAGALVVLAGVDLARRGRRRPGLLGLGLTALVAATVLGLVVHPSPRGGQALFRLLEAAAVGAALVQCLDRRPSATWRGLVAVGAGQALLAVGQVVRGGAVLPGLPFESTGLYEVGGLVAPKVGYLHPYLLAGSAAVLTGLLLTAAVRARGWAWAAAPALAAVPLALCFGRVAVLGVLLAAPVLLVAVLLDRRARLPVALLALSLGVTALLVRDGWLQRVQAQPVTGGSGSLDQFSSGRLTLARQALELWQTSPWTGVGPGRYLSEANARFGSEEVAVLPVHDVPLYLLAELGLLGGAGVVLLAVALAARAVSSRGALVVAALYVPFVLLDVPVVDPQGLLTVGLWAGAVVASSRAGTVSGAAASDGTAVS